MNDAAMRMIEQAEALRQLSSIEEIIEDARQGRMFILVDAENRENEGDLVIPAQMATPDAINFMARFGRGLICLALTPERANDLRLELMARSNESRHATAFTVSIEAREGISTGISAYDRAHTISVAINPEKSARDIVSPGHVFPLVAREGGVLVRAGHTEAAVDLARLAGLLPAGVICEIMNDDGTMARMPDLLAFAQRHGLKIGAIADLIAYRRKHDSLVRAVGEREIETAYGGAFQLRVYASTIDRTEHIAMVKGVIAGGEPVLVRMHAVNVLEDLLGIGRDRNRRSLVERALRRIGREGRGVLVLIRDSSATSASSRLKALEHDPEKLAPVFGKDHAGNKESERDADSVQNHRALGGAQGEKPDEKRLLDYGIGAQILLDLGVKNMVLLSNSPTPKIVGLEGYGLNLVARLPFDEQ
jgi:3,4-dihydroxy 2-butanone 4-phosphate synthase/GTP cyclohydrolase II